MENIFDLLNEAFKEAVNEFYARKDYKKLSKNIKQFASETDFVELVKEKYNKINGGK